MNVDFLQPEQKAQLPRYYSWFEQPGTMLLLPTSLAPQAWHTDNDNDNDIVQGRVG